MAVDALREGAKLVIGRNLNMQRGQDVVIVVDDTTYEVGQVLVTAACHLNVKPTMIHISLNEQAAYDNPDALPVPLIRALESAQAVIIAVSDIARGTGFRIALLDAVRGNHCKTAHMPGISKKMIASLAKTDYELLENGCEALRPALLLGCMVQITTHSYTGEQHELQLRLGKWDCLPTVSSGIVKPNSFSNVPSGETYVAPLKGTANGTIVINGSVTGHVFGNKDEIVITFVKGAITNIEPSDHPSALFLQSEIEKARQKGDQEPDYLCELGVGVNTAIKQLTGETLMDEKAYGTAHIAIGSNEHFGGNVMASHIHEDLVFRLPAIKIDSILIVKGGNLVIDDRDWRPNYRHIDVSASLYSNENSLVERANECDINVGAGGVLQRAYIDGKGIKCRITIGDNETGRLAKTIYKALPHNQPISIAHLSKKLESPISRVQAVLHIMGEIYGLTRVVNE